MNKQVLITGNLRTWLSTIDANIQLKEQIVRMLDDFVTQMEDVKKDLPTAKEGQLYIIKLIDNFIESDILNRQGEQVKCRKGCSFCCNINVTLTEGEFEVIVDTVKEKQIVIDWAVVAHQLSMNDKERCVAKKSACVFLKNNECSIYDTRPNACRLYHVISDPSICDTKTHISAQTTIPFSIYSELLISAYITVYKQDSQNLNYRLWGTSLLSKNIKDNKSC